MKNVVGVFEVGTLKTTGIHIDKLLPPVPRFNDGGNRVTKKQSVIIVHKAKRNSEFEVYPQGRSTWRINVKCLYVTDKWNRPC